jgi:hypothetical protein
VAAMVRAVSEPPSAIASVIGASFPGFDLANFDLASDSDIGRHVTTFDLKM